MGWGAVVAVHSLHLLLLLHHLPKAAGDPEATIVETVDGKYYLALETARKTDASAHKHQKTKQGVAHGMSHDYALAAKNTMAGDLRRGGPGPSAAAKAPARAAHTGQGSRPAGALDNQSGKMPAPKAGPKPVGDLKHQSGKMPVAGPSSSLGSSKIRLQSKGASEKGKKAVMAGQDQLGQAGRDRLLDLRKEQDKRDRRKYKLSSEKGELRKEKYKEDRTRKSYYSEQEIEEEVDRILEGTSMKSDNREKSNSRDRKKNRPQGSKTGSSASGDMKVPGASQDENRGLGLHHSASPQPVGNSQMNILTSLHGNAKSPAGGMVNISMLLPGPIPNNASYSGVANLNIQHTAPNGSQASVIQGGYVNKFSMPSPFANVTYDVYEVPPQGGYPGYQINQSQTGTTNGSNYYALQSTPPPGYANKILQSVSETQSPPLVTPWQGSVSVAPTISTTRQSAQMLQGMPTQNGQLPQGPATQNSQMLASPQSSITTPQARTIVPSMTERSTYMSMTSTGMASTTTTKGDDKSSGVVTVSPLQSSGSSTTGMGGSGNSSVSMMTTPTSTTSSMIDLSTAKPSSTTTKSSVFSNSSLMSNTNDKGMPNNTGASLSTFSVNGPAKIQSNSSSSIVGDKPYSKGKTGSDYSLSEQTKIRDTKSDTSEKGLSAGRPGENSSVSTSEIEIVEEAGSPSPRSGSNPSSKTITTSKNVPTSNSSSSRSLGVDYSVVEMEQEIKIPHDTDINETKSSTAKTDDLKKGASNQTKIVKEIKEESIETVTQSSSKADATGSPGSTTKASTKGETDKTKDVKDTSTTAITDNTPPSGSKDNDKPKVGNSTLNSTELDNGPEGLNMHITINDKSGDASHKPANVSSNASPGEEPAKKDAAAAGEDYADGGNIFPIPKAAPAKPPMHQILTVNNFKMGPLKQDGKEQRK